MDAPVKVLVVDDHASLRSGLALVLASDPGIEVVGEAADGAEAVRQVMLTRPDLVLMDVEMPVMDGIAGTKAVLRVAPRTRVLILTMFDLDEYVAGAMAAGASGFVLKTAAAPELIAAVHACASGETVLAKGVLDRVVDQFVGRHVTTPVAGADRLTEREQEVLALMCEGLSNQEIADRLVVELATVKTHVAHVLRKLQARDRLQAVVLAFRSGLATREGGRA